MNVAPLAHSTDGLIGLITFDSKPKITQGITYAIEDFRNSMNEMIAQGDTAVWDALALANDQLADYGQKYPNAKKRIICLSDGTDTDSGKKCYDVCEELIRAQVVMDSFCLGNDPSPELRAISYLTGGYKFLPKTLEQAMAICEMEPMLSQLERPAIERHVLVRPLSQIEFSTLSKRATPDVVTRDVYPQRKQHPNLDDTFIALSDLLTSAKGSALAPGDRANANMGIGRLLAEVRNVAANSHPKYEVFVSESNMGFWKIVMEGAPEGPYSEGTFLLYLHMGDDYPALPPKARFCTPIIHPNINRHGGVCHSILDRRYPRSSFRQLRLIRDRQLDVRHF